MCSHGDALDAARPPAEASGSTGQPRKADGGLAALCVEVAEILKIAPDMPPDVSGTIKALVRLLSLEDGGRRRLLDAVRIAARKGRRGRDGLQYAKGVLATKSGDRTAFFERFDAQLRAQSERDEDL